MPIFQSRFYGDPNPSIVYSKMNLGIVFVCGFSFPPRKENTLKKTALG